MKKQECPINTLKDICLLADIHITQKYLRTLTSVQREKLLNLASKIYLKANDNNVRIPKTPKWLEQYFENKKKKAGPV